MVGADWDAKLLAGLRALVASSFPKRCNNCGAVYVDVEDYVRRTAPVSATRSGLKQAAGDDGRPIVELFRNCVCGSTLMDSFGDRRDMSEAGAGRRRRFAELQAYLVATGLDAAVVRIELLKVVRGEGSALLSRLLPPTDE